MKKICRPLTLDAVDTHRREECLHYDSCLEQASALLWPSFSCVECIHFMATTNEKLVSYEKEVSALAWEV